MNIAQRQEVERAVLGVLAITKTTTTLDVKTFLRNASPQTPWIQADVAHVMANMSQLAYTDNGTFRDYYLDLTNGAGTTTVAVFPSADIRVSRSKMVDIIWNTKGRFFTAVFKKKDKSSRTLNGQVKKNDFMDSMGYIKVRENSTFGTRRINPRTLTSVSFEGTNYVLK